MNKTNNIYRKVSELIERHSAEKVEELLDRTAEELQYSESTKEIIKAVCSAFQVSKNITYSKLRKTTEEVEAYTYVIFFVNKYTANHKTLIATFNELNVNKSNRRTYYDNIKQYNVESLDEKIPRHRQIKEKVKIAETLIEQCLLHNASNDKRGVIMSGQNNTSNT